ncbi:hypothetical protein G7Y89_g14325 [Cudoniella acicularis]|uniref:DUF6604 domain-containing protein n=1 Tax=Cudoniella acicularis TaxID=354080 RepID=A0A8H4R6N8_9HELO|nr:hypothetical protein G7Y89_g14325 [Cudoniella acicularis]
MYQLEEIDFDYEFIIYCFFEDFNTIREFLQERWCDYQEGLLGLGAVTVVTNTAFELFQRAETDLLLKLPKKMGVDDLKILIFRLDDYEKISWQLLFEVGLDHVNYATMFATMKENETKCILSIDPFGDQLEWVCLPVLWHPQDFLDQTPIQIRAHSSMSSSWHRHEKENPEDDIRDCGSGMAAFYTNFASKCVSNLSQDNPNQPLTKTPLAQQRTKSPVD